jgi:hypothetical protein
MLVIYKADLELKVNPNPKEVVIRKMFLISIFLTTNFQL